MKKRCLYLHLLGCNGRFFTHKLQRATAFFTNVLGSFLSPSMALLAKMMFLTRAIIFIAVFLWGNIKSMRPVWSDTKNPKHNRLPFFTMRFHAVAVDLVDHYVRYFVWDHTV